MTRLLPLLAIMALFLGLVSVAHAQATTPTVSTVAVTSDPGSDNTYTTLDVITVGVTFSEAVTVTGTPQITLDIGGTEPTADYSGAGTAPGQLLFSYTVQPVDQDDDGVAAIRQQISDWAAQLTEAEFSLLVADLLVSVSAVSNTAGTYGSYLKRWKRVAKFPLHLQRSPIIPSAPGVRHEVHCEDANRLVRNLDSDAVYADPPYTKRQYAAYYHLLETIAAGDEPTITGSTGLRPWQHLASPYCYRRYAPPVLKDLVANSPGQHFFLSYSDDGQIRHSEILQILGACGSVAVKEYRTRRYRSNDSGYAVHQVVERFYHLDRDGGLGVCRCLL